MPVVPKPDDREFTPVPQGNHVALCYRVIDLGTQKGEYMGQTKVQHKVLVSWEIPDEKMGDGKPFTIGQKFTWSMSEKSNLRRVLESWRGRAFTEEDFGQNGFDIKNIIGIGCMLNVVHAKKGDKTYSNIATVARLPKTMQPPEGINKPVYVWLSHEEFNKAAYEELSEGLKTIIQAAPEFKALSEPERIADENDHSTSRTLDDMEGEEIPF